MSSIEPVTGNPAIDVALDTVKIGKQALVFANTKASAEKLAEDISKKLKLATPENREISESALKALSSPTKQCKRLALCLQNGAAFHHAGLVSKQRSLIEDEFKKGNIKIICATPSLAMGVNLPAYRTILKDLRRFTQRGLQFIPVLEYLQMSGRAGRPKFDDSGQSIMIASGEAERDKLYDTYILGEPEDIFSKLAVEPVLRTYLLSLIATGFVSDKKSLIDFFSKTFWAHQFMDMTRLSSIIDKMLDLLSDWEFVTVTGKEDFVAANAITEQKVAATPLGVRVSQLYIDPLTAHNMLTCLRKASNCRHNIFSYVHMVSYTLEMRPLLRVRAKEQEAVQDFLLKYNESILYPEPSLYDVEYEEFNDSIKTAMMLYDWCHEKSEDYLMQTYNVRPGELKGKLDIADWLVYTAEELCRIMQFQFLQKDLVKVRLRLQHGIGEELLPLVKIKGIGRVRARKLYNNGVKDVKDIKNTDQSTLAQLVGNAVAASLKKQMGQDVVEVSETKRKGQVSLNKF